MSRALFALFAPFGSTPSTSPRQAKRHKAASPQSRHDHPVLKLTTANRPKKPIPTTIQSTKTPSVREPKTETISPPPIPPASTPATKLRNPRFRPKNHLFLRFSLL